MQQTSVLAALRGRDGRSLARALAILLLLNLFAAGFHSGAMAAVDPLSVLCSAPGSAGNDAPPPARDHLDTCCLAGCPPVMAKTGDRLAVLVLAAAGRDRPAVPETAAPSAECPGAPRARGPPFLA